MLPALSFERIRRLPAIPLTMTLAIAVIARVTTLQFLGPTCGVDGYGYLNLARQLRGVKVPVLDLDPWSGMPRDDRGCRTPGYPIFLNCVFGLARHSPTPPRYTRTYQKQEVDDWHRSFLNSSENLRAVQFMQHLIGVMSVVLFFTLAWGSTANGWLAAGGSVIYLALRPSWLIFETQILTEVLCSFMLLALVGLVALLECRPRHSLTLMTFTSLWSGAVILVRPQFVFLPVLFCAWCVIRKYSTLLRTVPSVLIPCGLMVAGWIIRNGLRHHVWDLSQIRGIVMTSHFVLTPDELPPDAALQEVIRARPGDKYVIARSYPVLMKKWGLSLSETDRRLRGYALETMLHHPVAFMRSILTSTMNFWYPTEVLLPANRWRADPILRWLRYSVLLGFLLLKCAGLTRARFPLSSAGGFALLLAVSSAVLTAMMTACDNGRYSFGLEALLGLAALEAITWRRLPPPVRLYREPLH